MPTVDRGNSSQGVPRTDNGSHDGDRQRRDRRTGICARPRTDFDFAAATPAEALAFVRSEVAKRPEDFNFGGVMRLAETSIPGLRTALMTVAGTLRAAAADPSKLGSASALLKLLCYGLKGNPILAFVPQIAEKLNSAIRYLDEIIAHPEAIPQDIVRDAADLVERLASNPSSVTFADLTKLATAYPVMGTTLHSGVQFEFGPEQLSTIVEQYVLDPERVVRDVWLAEEVDQWTDLKLFRYPRSRRVLRVMQDYGFLPRHL